MGILYYFTCQILKEMGILYYFTCLLRNLYVGQRTVRTIYRTTDRFKTGEEYFFLFLIEKDPYALDARVEVTEMTFY